MVRCDVILSVLLGVMLSVLLSVILAVMMFSVQAVLVPTAATVKLQFFMRLLLDCAQPVMLVGGAGVGKTTLVQNLLDSLPETFLSLSVPLHYYSTSSSVQSESFNILQVEQCLLVGCRGT